MSLFLKSQTLDKAGMGTANKALQKTDPARSDT